MNQDTLRKYARTLLQYGVNLQQDQTLVISVDVENKDFAVIVTEEAYQLGAKEVVLNWRCSPIARQRLMHAKETVLEKPANWIPEFYKQYIDDKAAFLSLISANPKALEGIPTNRISLQSRNLNKALSFYHTAIMKSSVMKVPMKKKLTNCGQLCLNFVASKALRQRIHTVTTWLNYAIVAKQLIN